MEKHERERLGFRQNKSLKDVEGSQTFAGVSLMTTTPSSGSFFVQVSGVVSCSCAIHQWRSPSMTQHVTRLAKGVLARDKIPRAAGSTTGAEQHDEVHVASVDMALTTT